MPIPRPTTADAPAMLEPDGWPGIEEDLVSDLAVMLRRTCAQLEDVGEACWEARGCCLRMVVGRARPAPQPL